MVYSSLPRNFLIQSFKQYGIQLEIYSKIDFNFRKKNDAIYLAEKITNLGDEHWELRNNQPTGKEWSENILPIYLHLKNQPSFFTSQQYIGKEARQNLDNFIERFTTCKDEYDLWNLKLADKIDRQASSINPDIINEAKIATVENILLIRRVAIGIFAFLHSNKNNSNLLDEKQYLNYTQMILYCSSGMTLSNVKTDIDIGRDNFEENLPKLLRDKKPNQNFLHCGLTLSKMWPLGLLPEEYAWLSFNSGLEENYLKAVKTYFTFFHRVKPLFKECFENSTYFQSTLEDGNIKVSKTKTILLNDDYEPLIRSADDIKAILKYLRDVLEKSPSLNKDFPIYIQLWRACYQAVKSLDNADLLHKELATIKHFMRVTIKNLDYQAMKKIKAKYCKAIDYMQEEEGWSYEDVEYYKKTFRERTNFSIEEEYVHLHNPVDFYYSTEDRTSSGYINKLTKVKERFDLVFNLHEKPLQEKFYTYLSELEVNPYYHVITHHKKNSNREVFNEIVYRSIVAKKNELKKRFTEKQRVSSLQDSPYENSDDRNPHLGEEDPQFLNYDEISIK